MVAELISFSQSILSVVEEVFGYYCSNFTLLSYYKDRFIHLYQFCVSTSLVDSHPQTKAFELYYIPFELQMFGVLVGGNSKNLR